MNKRKKNLTRRKRRGGTLGNLVNLENLKPNEGSTTDAMLKIKKYKEDKKKTIDAMFDKKQTHDLFNPLLKPKSTNN